MNEATPASSPGTGTGISSQESTLTSTIPPQSSSLTTILLETAPEALRSATQHPFLRLAGSGSLPKDTLSHWLSQDRLYAQSYIGFIGALIARVDLPDAHTAEKDKQSILPWRIVRLLSSALANIQRELAFFEITADAYGLRLDAPSPSRSDGLFAADPATREYIELFRSFGADPSKSLLQGLVVLWATETVYLCAWTYAASFANAKVNKSGTASDGVGIGSGTAQRKDSLTTTSDTHDAFVADMDSGALRSAFIPNWTSAEFRQFVNDIQEVTDLLAERTQAIDRELHVYKDVWAHVLDVESRFWPSVETACTEGN